MALDGSSSALVNSKIEAEKQTPKTVESALSLLNSLKPRIFDILAGQRLRVVLNRMDVMKPDRSDLNKAHVLWLGPSLEGENAQLLSDVSGM